ncbi:WXG100 family type VII secretion target [Sinomonas mesophila]|uniref:WXG100 family type VII secretion target n=1 Tax=Sinomonas mesophila TaxID=1531955 RepID=UPI000984CD11|nr:WXG100 family type VII secretion target [Sinomonas mesophila]
MAIRQGANVEQLRDVAKQFNSKAEEIASIKNNLNGLISNNIPENWSGRDAEQFRSNWHAEGLKSLNKLIDELREAAKTMDTNARVQEQTSNSLS